MERDRELAKLTGALRRIARAARHAAWTRDAGAARFCAAQYKMVRAPLGELEPGVSSLFTALPENASAELIRIAAHELPAYFEDEAGGVAARGVGIGRHGCGGHRAWAGRVRLGSCW